ncbi:MAG: hypothetical protein E6G21_02755 [Actinobacteria bacterium]|nr:MAG: hypothetical protein E6G21_02755 [Actinomycetota bacterium]
MRGRDDPGLGTRVQLPDLRGRPAGARGAARPRPQARPRLEHRPRPGRVRRPIFQAALERLEVEPAAAVMVGDSIEDDVEGANAVGMRGLLLDRENRYPEVEEKLTDLGGLPAALGLAGPASQLNT